MTNLGGFSEEALQLFQLAASERGYDEFAEEGETYDFARCVRPDGSAYGTGGKCRKGTEEAKAPKKPLPTRATSGKVKQLQDRISRGDRAAMDEMRKLRAEGKVGKESAKAWGPSAKQKADEDIEGLRELMRNSPAAQRAITATPGMAAKAKAAKAKLKAEKAANGGKRTDRIQEEKRLAQNKAQRERDAQLKANQEKQAKMNKG
jgi:hypothetical protein